MWLSTHHQPHSPLWCVLPLAQKTEVRKKIKSDFKNDHLAVESSSQALGGLKKEAQGEGVTGPPPRNERDARCTIFYVVFVLDKCTFLVFRDLERVLVPFTLTVHMDWTHLSPHFMAPRLSPPLALTQDTIASHLVLSFSSWLVTRWTPAGLIRN